MPAKLIQSNEGFNLYNLLEIQYFINQLNLGEDIYMISNDDWALAKRKLAEKYKGSSNLEACINLINDFEAANTKNKYKTDLEAYVRESKLESFYGEKLETIYVSTIHKAKGREFDNVFLMLNQYNSGTDEAIRHLYVAMTRAKHSLTIHYNGYYLEPIKTEQLERIADRGIYPPPEQLVMQLTFKDVWLDFFLSCQQLISELNSGDKLTVDENCCRNSKGQPVLRFSKLFMSQIESMKQKSYVPKTAEIRFIIYWQKEDMEHKIRIILPEIYFEKQGNT